MASVQIYSESPISPIIHAPSKALSQASSQDSTATSENVTSLATASQANQDQQAKATRTPAPTARYPTESYTSPRAPAEPGISPPTPTAASLESHVALGPDATPSVPSRNSSVSPASPSPQSNSLPTPILTRSRSASPRRDIPPPPKVGEKMQPASYYSPTPTPTSAAHQQSFQPQPGFLPLSEAQGGPQPIRSATFAAQNGLLSPHPNNLLSPARTFGSPSQTPTTADMPHKSLEHPPGYVQNPYAADMTPEQRFTSQRAAGSPTLGYSDQNSGLAGMKSPSGVLQGLSGMVSPRPGGGILNGDGKTEEGSVWGMVSGWAKGAGKKLGEVEGEVWRRINGE